SATVIETDSYVGSGSLPDHAVPSFGVGLKTPDNDEVARILRMGDPAVASRLEDDYLKLEMRTVQPDELNKLAELVNEAAEDLWA
ncbi:MAG: hypothetical protein GF388_07935, partial [Candidatus Aegiribacteria sp.]|nr:hypothetical protein [Candidatus Aegiribacteria sp.]MBD3295040.1 hypothetical protein [Candidatus Fermentibacteria bacterium]